MNKFYITTPIYYVNDIPHIGHAYCTLATDTIARYWRKKLGKENVLFVTGTDENSQKTVDAAKKRNQDIYEYLDEMAQNWRNTWDQIGVSYDDFIRTTEDRHVETVHEIFNKIHEKGDIYKGNYEGLYCTGCETFKKKSDLDENGICSDHPNLEIQVLKEDNYFFRLSNYTDQLLDLYQNQPEWLLPKSRKNEILSFINSGLEDISVSRETAEFGISLPMDDKHKVYVWFDALINYYSAVKNTDKADFWNGVEHVVGKDITRFHCVIWPAMLIAAGIKIPNKVFAHGFFTVDGTKMSKSLGNVISPIELSDKFGNDALRTGLLSSFEFGSDGDFSQDNFAQFYNSKLGSGIGNLFNRVIVLLHKFEDGNKPVLNSQEANDLIQNKYTIFAELIEKKKIKAAIDYFFEIVDEANTRLSETEVWKLAKTDPAAATIIFAELYQYLIVLTEMSEVILPESSVKMKKMLNLGNTDDANKVGEAVILFERI